MVAGLLGGGAGVGGGASCRDAGCEGAACGGEMLGVGLAPVPDILRICMVADLYGGLQGIPNL